MESEIGLYFHFPFCKQKCNYCDFNSYCGIEDLIPGYMEAMILEVERDLPQSRPVGSIYFGGGTPSVLPPDLLVYFLNFIRDNFLLKDKTEITLEINPGTTNLDALILFKNAGFNRLSIGLQAVQDRLLQTIGRIHRWLDFQQIYESAREVGFDNINIDLIFGLPGQTIADWKESLEKVTQLKPEHISAYGLQLEEETPLDKLVKSGSLTLPPEDVVVEMMQWVMNFLPEAGYQQYEISNYSKPEYQSRHNLYYWIGHDYLGFGAGACSTFQQHRWSNWAEPREYINKILKGYPVVEESETIDRSIAAIERLMLGLRLRKGIDLKDFQDEFQIDLTKKLRKEIAQLQSNGLVNLTKSHLSLTDKGVLLSNTVIADLIGILNE